jgi:hypothetical protein
MNSSGQLARAVSVPYWRFYDCVRLGLAGQRRRVLVSGAETKKPASRLDCGRNSEDCLLSHKFGAASSPYAE